MKGIVEGVQNNPKKINKNGSREVVVCCPCCNNIAGVTSFKTVAESPAKSNVYVRECGKCNTALIDDGKGLSIAGSRLVKGKWVDYNADRLLRVAGYKECTDAYIEKSKELVKNGKLSIWKIDKEVLKDMTEHCDSVIQVLGNTGNKSVIKKVLEPAKEQVEHDVLLNKKVLNKINPNKNEKISICKG